MRNESNYEKVFEVFRSYFLESDQEKAAEKLDLKIDRDYCYVPFFHEICKINRKNGMICKENGEKVSVTDRLSILHHLHYYQDTAIQSSQKVPFRQIREASVFEKAYIKSSVEPLKKAFAGSPEKLVESGLLIGGKKESYGDASITLQAFPKISLTYIFWDGDEEFPASVNILFDDQIAKWTHPESVPVLAQTGAEKLIEKAFGKSFSERV